MNGPGRAVPTRLVVVMVFAALLGAGLHLVLRVHDASVERWTPSAGPSAVRSPSGGAKVLPPPVAEAASSVATDEPHARDSPTDALTDARAQREGALPSRPLHRAGSLTLPSESLRPGEVVRLRLRSETPELVAGEPCTLVLESTVSDGFRDLPPESRPRWALGGVLHGRLGGQREWSVRLAGYADDGLALNVGGGPIADATRSFVVQPLTLAELEDSLNASREILLKFEATARWKDERHVVESNVVSVTTLPVPSQDHEAARLLLSKDPWRPSWRGRSQFRFGVQDETYVQGLEDFLERHNRSVYAPHLMLERAIVEVESEAAVDTLSREERYALLERVVTEFPHFRGLPEVLCWMGRISALASSGSAFDSKSAERLLQRVVQDYPDSLWRERAEQELKRLEVGRR